MAAVVGLCAIGFLAGAHLKSRPSAPLRILQITAPGSVSPGDPFLENLPEVASDGVRLYFPQVEGDRTRLAQTPIASGEISDLTLPSEIIAPLLADISEDASRLLIRNRVAGEPEQTIWIVPSAGGTARQIPGIRAHDATWMPDDQHILYANGNALFVAREDGSDVRQFAAVPGRGFWLRWSPDGRKLRMTLLNPRNHETTLWEIGSSGQDLHALFPGWSTPASECCGSWTSDGNYFVFQSSHTGGANIWALQEKHSLFGPPSGPLQLTNGPLDYQAPVAAHGGHEIFFIGNNVRSDLLQYSASTKSFVSYGVGLTAAYRVEFSHDGSLMAWISQDGSLWRSRERWLG